MATKAAAKANMPTPFWKGNPAAVGGGGAAPKTKRRKPMKRKAK